MGGLAIGILIGKVTLYCLRGGGAKLCNTLRSYCRQVVRMVRKWCTPSVNGDGFRLKVWHRWREEKLDEHADCSDYSDGIMLTSDDDGSASEFEVQPAPTNAIYAVGAGALFPSDPPNQHQQITPSSGYGEASC